MIFKVFGVVQIILIQVISAQLSRDLSKQNVLNYLTNTVLAEYGRSRRQIDNAAVDSPGSGDLPINGFSNSLPLRNGMPFGSLTRGGGLIKNFGLPNNYFNNGLPNSFALNNGMALPNNSPFNLPLPFPNMNIAPQNGLQPNVNGININGPFNIPKGLPNFNNVPNELPSFNNVPNGLPSFNNVPNGFPSFNNMPNGLPGLNNVPKGLPSFNNVPEELPSFNNVPNGLPSFNNMPNGLPGLNNVPKRLPSFNNVPNNLPFPNNVLNLNNVPAGNNILNFNHLPAANSLPNINNILPIPNGLPSFNNSPCGNAVPALPLSNGLPLNSLPSGNLLQPINNQLPYLNNFRITEIGIGNRVYDMNRFPRNDFPNGIMLPNANNLQNGYGLAQQVADELSSMYNYQNDNGFSDMTNTPPAGTLPNNVSADNRFSSINNFPNSNYGVNNIAVEAKNINNNMQLNNDQPDTSNFQNFNVMPVNEQRFVSNIPFNNGVADSINFPANIAMPNANSRLVNAINKGMPLSNGGHLNDILSANNDMAVNMLEKYVKNNEGNRFASNDFQFGDVQVPGNNRHYDLVGAKLPANQNLLSEGVQMFSNVPSDYQKVLMPNNLNLAQELIKNLQIEGNMPFLNGLPVAGITETVTVLNGPYSK